MKKNSSNLNKKRARPVSPLTITIGKLPNDKYYYISDTISGKVNNTKIKISMVDMKEEKQAEKKVASSYLNCSEKKVIGILYRKKAFHNGLGARTFNNSKNQILLIYDWLSWKTDNRVLLFCQTW